MIHKTETLEDLSIFAPITQQEREIAQQFANQQPTPQKAEQVYYNTLAVCSVNNYLRIMGILTDLGASDSWNPAVRLFHDVADLAVTDVGKLECRSLRRIELGAEVAQKPNSNHMQSQSIDTEPTSSPKSTSPVCYIPSEVHDDRIGYVVVQIDDEQQEATLLGFTEKVETEELPISQLRSLKDLLKHIHQLKQSQSVKEPVNLSQWLVNVFETGWQEIESLFSKVPEPTASASRSTAQSNLGQWFQNIFDEGWQAIENLFGSERNINVQFRGALDSRQKAATAFRRGEAGIQLFPAEADVMRAKLVDLGMQLGTITIALVVALTKESDERVNILVQVHPPVGKTYLPPHLKLILLSDTGEPLQEVESRGQDICIQLKPFKVQPGTSFSLQVGLDDVSITEAFAV